jgi:hypothetical protein
MNLSTLKNMAMQKEHEDYYYCYYYFHPEKIYMLYHNHLVLADRAV